MKMTYRIEIGIMKGKARMTLREKVEMDECIMKELLDVLLLCKPLSLTNIIIEQDLNKEASIESIEIRED